MKIIMLLMVLMPLLTIASQKEIGFFEDIPHPKSSPRSMTKSVSCPENNEDILQRSKINEDAIKLEQRITYSQLKIKELEDKLQATRLVYRPYNTPVVAVVCCVSTFAVTYLLLRK